LAVVIKLNRCVMSGERRSVYREALGREEVTDF
jgi:hypothetical protein